MADKITDNNTWPAKTDKKQVTDRDRQSTALDWNNAKDRLAEHADEIGDTQQPDGGSILGRLASLESGAGGSLNYLAAAGFQPPIITGGTVDTQASVITDLDPALFGSVDPLLVMSLGDPQPSGGPVIVRFPLDLPAGTLPESVEFDLAVIEPGGGGSNPFDYFVALSFEAGGVGHGLSYLLDQPMVQPGGQAADQFFEGRPTGIQPGASWIGPMMDPSNTQVIQGRFRHVSPLAAAPSNNQWELDARVYRYGDNDPRWILGPVQPPDNGTYNQDSSWDGLSFEGLSLLIGTTASAFAQADVLIRLGVSVDLAVGP